MPPLPADTAASRRWRRCAALAIAAGLAFAPLSAPGQSLFSQPESLPSSGSLASPGTSLVAPDPATQSIPRRTFTPGPAASGARPSAASIIPPALGGVTVSARFTEGPPIASKLHWRVFAEKPDSTGAFRIIKEDTAAAPTFVLPPGGYIVHVALGMASTAKRIQVHTETARETLELAAGAVRFEGRVGDTPIPPGQITFEVYPGSQFDPGDRQPIISDVRGGSLIVLPEGVYYVVSAYGDGNAVMRYDFRVQSGKLTDARINHRAAVITLKLVSETGGEAIANTAWSVLTPGGDVIKESIGAFPTVVLAEGEYTAIARNEGKVYRREFKVEPGVDREIEVLAR